MADELSATPPESVEYSFLRPSNSSAGVLRSPIKGYLRHFEAGELDLIEAVLSPIYTRDRWIYSLACFQEAVAFNVMGVPVPRGLRVAYMRRLFMRENCKRLVFWSHAGRETLHSYGGIVGELTEKSTVVYPAIRRVDDQLVQFRDEPLLLLFSGDFFRKGGVNVIDAFERIQPRYPDLTLRLCCDERIDFNTPDDALRWDYLGRIHANERIVLGRASREELLNDILPRTDIYLLPTYVEAFGFAILEAMAYGIPVVSTNHFAIPEMIEHGTSGLLIDTSEFDCDRLFRGYIVRKIPADFRDHVTGGLYSNLIALLESQELRRKLGLNALHLARTRFSFETRNRTMLDIYRHAMQ